MIRSRHAAAFALAAAVLITGAASADSYLAYSQAGIPFSSDIFTWCDTPPCDVSGVVSCDTPEGGASLRVNTNAWGGLGVFLQGGPVDLSQFEDGALTFFAKSGFDLKVEFQCTVGDPPAVSTYTRFLSQHGWDGTPTWQQISIPTCDAAALDCLANVTAPFMTTIENLPFFNSFQVDSVRWDRATSHAGASDVDVVNREFYVDGEPFIINGVAYSPIAIGENWANGWANRPDRYLVDFPKMAEAGINVVRLYAPILDTQMLDAAWANGLYVMPTFAVDFNQLSCPTGKAFMQAEFLAMVEKWKDHPAILAWLIANELNVEIDNTTLCTDWYPQLDAMAAAAKALEGATAHPVGTANADVTGNLGDVCQAGCSTDTDMPNLDFWGIQLYRGCTYGSALSQYAAKADCDRPLVITEFGADAYDSVLGIENQNLQQGCLDDMLEEAQLNHASTTGGVLAGQVVFEWADEWWKAECEPTTPSSAPRSRPLSRSK